MAKEKSKPGLKNRHLHARVAYLHQAATYLTNVHSESQHVKESLPGNVEGTEQSDKTHSEQEATDTCSGNGTTPFQRGAISINKPSSGGLPLYLSSHLSQVARKSQIRLAPEVKHSICKRCGTIQVEGSTSKKFTENLSKRGKKQHADVLVQECGVCGAKKRWPVGARRQKTKFQRQQATVDADNGGQADPGATNLNLAESNAG